MQQKLSSPNKGFRVPKMKKLIALSTLALSVSAAFGTPTLVTSVAALGTTDSLAWSYLGGDGSIAPANSTLKTSANISVTVALAGNQGLASVVGTSWSVQTGPAMTGDSLLWAYDNSVGVNAGSGPVTLTFPATSGVGAAIQADVPGQFTAVLTLYSGSTLLATVMETSDAKGDAIFIGAVDSTADITSAVFSLSSSSGDVNDFAIDTVYFTQAGKTSVTVGTNPAGASFTVDNVSYQSSQTFSWVKGSSHTIATTATQPAGTGTQYAFTSWSDSGALSHTVIASASTSGYTANFNTQYQLTTAAGIGGTVSPVSGTYYNPGTVVTVTATPNPNYLFSSWTGPVAAASSPSTSVTMSAPASITANFKSTISAAAIYRGLDTTAKGTWTGTYGSGGYIIANDANTPPPYAIVSLTGDAAWTWVNPTTDMRALQTASGASTRIASTFYSTGSSFNINVNLTDGNAHRVALYLLDWDTTSRAQTISILDASTNLVLDTESFSNFSNGEYAIWNLTGNVIIQVTRTNGINAVVAGIFFDPAPAATAPIITAITAANITSTSAVITWTTDQASSSLVNYGTTTAYGSSSTLNSSLVMSHSATLTGLIPGTTYNYDVVSANSASVSSTSANHTFATLSSTLASSATYLPLDTTTRGAWTAVYGSDGYIIANDANSAPNYASVSFTGQSAWTWITPTSDPRALQISNASSTRIASTYYAPNSFSINVNLTDGNAHRIALYLLDWDGGSRAETISILDAGSHAVLSAQSFSNFQNGEYASWDIKGSVSIQVTLTGGENAVVSGIFFGGAVSSGAPVISSVAASNITSTSAVISWTTDQASSSLVNYGTSNAYGSSSALNAALVTNHSVMLSGLTPGVTYDYDVVSANASSTSSTSANFTFATLTSGTPTSSATYLALDTTTHGTWTGHYGSNGYLIANDGNNLPAFATTSLTGDSIWTFASVTTDPRALQVSSGSGVRIAAVFYSTSGSFNINLNLTDGKSHRIALYLLDWDTTMRAETITIMDANSHTVLNTQSFASFQNGQYASWNITGNVIIQVADTAGINAVVSGIFVD